MKILLIHSYYQYYGGEERYFESLCKLLKDKGHNIYIYTKDSRKINEKSIFAKIKIALRLIWNFQVEEELSQIIKDFKPDVVHFNNIYPLIGATAYRVCHKYKVPIVQTIHNYRFICPKGILFRKGRICELCVRKKFPYYSILFGCYHGSRLASIFFSLAFYFHKLIGTLNFIDKYIFPSEFTQNYYLKNLDISKKNTTVIPYYIDIEKRTGNKIQKKYFLFAGRLSEEKGIIQLLELFKKLPKNNLIVIGDGPLKKEVDKYKKYKNIKIIGFLPQDKLKSYMQNAIAVIIPSLWYEVLPFVYIESLANRTSVIVMQNNNFDSLQKLDRAYFEFILKFNNFEDLKNIISQKQKNIHFRLSQYRYSSINHYRAIFKEYRTISHTS